MFDKGELNTAGLRTVSVIVDDRASPPGPGTAQPEAATVPPEPPAVPLERLEAQICELAGHLTAATCRFLVLLGDFDARRGWASWDMNSCAEWLSWKCQMSSGTAREHVRVARALRGLTRIATPGTEAGLAEIAGPMTGNQLERFARAHRRVSSVDDAAARVRRRLTWHMEEDGSLAGSFRLPPLEGAVLLKALRTAAGDLVHPHQPHDGDVGVSAETPADGGPGPQAPDGTPTVATSSSLADALVAVAEQFLVGKVAAADDPEVYQVVVHVGTGALAAQPPSAPEAGHGSDARREPGVSAETPAVAPVPGDPADPGRCQVEDGPAISVTTAQMIACTAALSWMRHDRGGAVLNLGRRRRRPNAAIRRAARERDKCRCRFPGCESRRVDLHHIQHWVNGGHTKLTNLISMCRYHHMLVHERGYLITAAGNGTFAFYRPDGAAIPPSLALPEADGSIDGCHDACITPETIVPAWCGERLDLDHAIYVCFANAANQARRQGQPDQDYPQDDEGQTEPFQPRKWVSEMADWQFDRLVDTAAAPGL